MDRQDKVGLSVALKPYKFENGAVNFTQLLKIPSSDRLPELIKKEGLERIHKMLGAAIHMAMESLNLQQGLTANQTFDLVDEILDTSSEDFLGLEDVMLFLQKLVRGEAGKLYKHIDRATFMEMFEKYRQTRHIAYLREKEEQEAQYKISGKTSQRVSVEKDKDMEPAVFFDLLQTYNEERNEKP